MLAVYELLHYRNARLEIALNFDAGLGVFRQSSRGRLSFSALAGGELFTFRDGQRTSCPNHELVGIVVEPLRQAPIR